MFSLSFFTTYVWKFSSFYERFSFGWSLLLWFTFFYKEYSLLGILAYGSSFRELFLETYYYKHSKPAYINFWNEFHIYRSLNAIDTFIFINHCYQLYITLILCKQKNTLTMTIRVLFKIMLRGTPFVFISTVKHPIGYEAIGWGEFKRGREDLNLKG